MIESKLLQSIRPLQAWDLRHLHDFVHSPFFNKHERLTKLMDHVIGLAPDYAAEFLERKVVYALIFEGEPWDEQKFKDLLSMGVKLMRQFFAQMRIKNAPESITLLTLEDLLDRGQEAEFIKARKSAEENLESSVEKRQELLLKRLLIQEIWISHQTEMASRKADDSIQLASDQLDAYYALSKLRYAVEMANRKQVVAQDFDQGMLPQLLQYLDAHANKVQENTPIKIYLLILQCLTQTESANAFEELVSHIHEGLDFFPMQERREILAYALNYCIRQVNQGRQAYLKTLVELYRVGLETQVLTSQGWLSQWDYKNIVSAGLKAGMVEWSQEFIQKYKDKVEPDARENAHTYNLALWHFEQGEYRTALRLLQHVEFSDVFYHLGAKVMLLKSFYELNEPEALNALCDSFKIYLKRNKTLSKAHYTVNFNLIGFTRQLSEIRRKADLQPLSITRSKLSALRTKVAATKAVAQLPWLKAKMDALEGELR